MKIFVNKSSSFYFNQSYKNGEKKFEINSNKAKLVVKFYIKKNII